MLPTLMLTCLLQVSNGGTTPQRDVPSPPRQPEPSVAADVADAPAKRRFEALLAALRAYEGAVRGLAWDQEVDLDPLPHGSGRRTLGWQTSFVVAPDGRWSIWSKRAAASGERGSRVEERFMFDGKSVLASSPTTKSGVIRGHDDIELHESLLSPIMLIGGSGAERVASPLMHRLSDTLAELQDVAVDESAAPLIRLSGSRQSGGKWERVEVSLDSDRGFMPVQYRRSLEIFNAVREEMITTEAELVGKAWVPTAGTRVVYGLQPSDAMGALTPEQRADLGKQYRDRVAAANLSPERFSDRSKMGQIMRSVFKFDSMTSVPLGGNKHLLRARNIRIVTAEEASKALMSPFEEGYTVTDSRTGSTYRFLDGKLVPTGAPPAP